MNKHEIFRFIDHTLLKQNAVWEQIREICQEGMDLERPRYVSHLLL